MLINIYDLNENNLEVNKKGNLNELEINIDKNINLKEDSKYSLTVKLVNDQYFLYGSIEADLKLTCDRCLEDYDSSLKLNYSYEIAEIKDKNIKEQYIEEEILFIVNGVLNIKEIINEEIILNLPFKKICDDSCEGIIIKSNDIKVLSEEEKEAEIDPRLSKLRGFFEDK